MSVIEDGPEPSEVSDAFLEVCKSRGHPRIIRTEDGKSWLCFCGASPPLPDAPPDPSPDESSPEAQPQTPPDPDTETAPHPSDVA